MKLKFIIIYIFIILIINSCNNYSGSNNESITKRIQLDSSFVPHQLSPVVKISNEVFNLPNDLEVVGPYLVLLDQSVSPALHLIDKNEHKYIKSFGQKGEGPGEFLTPLSIQLRNFKEDEIWIYDGSLFRFSSFKLVQKQDNVLFKPENIIYLDSDIGPPLNVSWLNKALIISTGMYSQGRVAYFDLNGSVLKTVGNLPSLSHKRSIIPFFNRTRKVPISVLQHAYQSHIQKKPDQSLFVIAARHADRLEIYNQNGEKIHMIVGHKNFEPNIEVRNVDGHPVLASGEDFRFGYIDLATTNKYIFGLYSGRIRAEGNANFGTYIHVFDWDGNLKKMFELDEYLLSIKVAEDRLYGIQHFPDLNLNVYNLSEFDF